MVMPPYQLLRIDRLDGCAIRRVHAFVRVVRSGNDAVRNPGRNALAMRLARICTAAFAALTLATVTTYAAKNPVVGGKEMFPNKNIIENAVNSADHTTLVTAVKAAGLVETLQGAGPFTVFAPTNAAFAKLPSGTVDTLLTP